MAVAEFSRASERLAGVGEAVDDGSERVHRVAEGVVAFGFLEETVAAESEVGAGDEFGPAGSW